MIPSKSLQYCSKRNFAFSLRTAHQYLQGFSLSRRAHKGEEATHAYSPYGCQIKHNKILQEVIMQQVSGSWEVEEPEADTGAQEDL